MTSRVQFPGSKSARRAFTMIELMLVVAILGVLLAIGIPAFVRALTKEGMRKAVSDMVEACNHARAQAIMTGLPTELVIVDRSITVRQGMAVEDEFAPPPAPGADRSRFTGFSATLPESVAFELLMVNFKDHLIEDQAVVRFFPNGTSDEFATVLLSEELERRMISLDIVTALAEVENDPQQFLKRH